MQFSVAASSQQICDIAGLILAFPHSLALGFRVSVGGVRWIFLARKIHRIP